MAIEYMLTTVDNPYDPFDQFDSWHLFDKEKGYNSCERLMRIAKLEDGMSEEEENIELERAMDRIIELDVFDIFIKAQREVEDTTQADE